MKRLLFTLAASALALSANAASINPADLPSAVQSCLGTGQCGVNLSSSFEQTVPGAGSIAAFQWTDFRSGSPVAKYLVRYNLAPVRATRMPAWTAAAPHCRPRPRR
jgi:hypothetical protein